MSARWRFPRPYIFASPGLDRRRLVDRRCSHKFSGPMAGERTLADACPVLFRTVVDRATLLAQFSRCGKEPDTLARRRPTPTDWPSSASSDCPRKVIRLARLDAVFVLDSVTEAVDAREQRRNPGLTFALEHADMCTSADRSVAFRASLSSTFPLLPALVKVGD
jgi:hypothetical protein